MYQFNNVPACSFPHNYVNIITVFCFIDFLCGHQQCKEISSKSVFKLSNQVTEVVKYVEWEWYACIAK